MAERTIRHAKKDIYTRLCRNPFHINSNSNILCCKTITIWACPWPKQALLEDAYWRGDISPKVHVDGWRTHAQHWTEQIVLRVRHLRQRIMGKYAPGRKILKLSLTLTSPLHLYTYLFPLRCIFWGIDKHDFQPGETCEPQVTLWPRTLSVSLSNREFKTVAMQK